MLNFISGNTIGTKAIPGNCLHYPGIEIGLHGIMNVKPILYRLTFHCFQSTVQKLHVIIVERSGKLA